ncbi:MAG: M13 family metallopeptidase [Bacteroidetes bacterium]|nr:M13 family metallopeptidase [Bacteroidota bacterium]
MKIWILTGVAATALFSFVHRGNDGGYQALNLSYMDRSVNPADDFYNYVNGSWMKNAVIPSDRGRWGAFEQLGKLADSQSLAVLEEALHSGKYGPETDQGKAVALYASVMDTLTRNKLGTKPLLEDLKAVKKVKNMKSLSALLQKQMATGDCAFFNIGVSADAKNSDKNAVYLGTAGLGLPDRDYYLKTDEKSAEKQEKYRAFVANMLREFGFSASDAKNAATRIYELEKALATPMLTKEQRRNPEIQYNPYSTGAAAGLLSQVSIPGCMAAIALSPDTVIVSEPEYFKTLNTLIQKDRLSDLKLLMQWSLIRNAAGTLSMPIERLSFDFYGRYLRGTPAQRPLKERALATVNRTLGEALGKLYVDKYFSQESKDKARQLVDDLIAAYRQRINNLEWMSTATKAMAQRKLDRLMIKIGYPDKWKDYSALVFVAKGKKSSYYDNMQRAGAFEIKRNAEKYGKPVDKTEWMMSPQTVNAYYNPSYNEIVFPAAILQAPFFDARADAAVNFGGIGAVIGHEISHGFDDEGAKFDEYGNLVNWWTEEDEKQFKERGALLAKQFNGFEALPGQFVNGEFTMGENIGDLGGINAAYDGLQIHLNRSGSRPEIDGFTPEQRFFMSWATVWRNKIRDEELSMRLKTDPHSPGYFRAIGPLQNHEGFYKAFGVTPDNKMYRPDSLRVHIW